MQAQEQVRCRLLAGRLGRVEVQGDAVPGVAPDYYGTPCICVALRNIVSNPQPASTNEILLLDLEVVALP